MHSVHIPPKKKQEIVDKRFNLPPAQYLESFQLNVYMQDAIKQLLEIREEQPLDFLANYFAGILKGNHVMFREFDFINATYRNRSAFVQLFHQIHGPSMAASTTAFSLLDHLHLARLLCPDFGQICYEKAAKWIHAGALDTPCSYQSASAYWQLYFVFAEFLERSEAIFTELESSNLNGRVDNIKLLVRLKNISDTTKPGGAPSSAVLDAAIMNCGDGKYSSFAQILAALAASPALIIK